MRDALVLAIVFGVGYVAAAAWLSPVPLFTSDHAVPRVLDLTAGEAQRRLTELGFRVKIEDEEPHPSIARGHIVWQDPPPGVVLGQHSTVSISPSAGALGVPVPDLVGLAQPQAEKILAAAGLKRGEVDTIAADPEPGIVVATRPAAGATRTPGSEVALVVSGRALIGMAGAGAGAGAPR
ncbi:MAG TPA: PASTA domain-containing protein [Gemmatimonadales bacterium]|nr:PASTA domain-containing protein [Gemmatimonadales bacterium]